MEDPLNEVNSADFLLDLLALEDKVSTRDY